MSRRKKKLFEEPYLETVRFPQDDVITTSGIVTPPDWFEDGEEDDVPKATDVYSNR